MFIARCVPHVPTEVQCEGLLRETLGVFPGPWEHTSKEEQRCATIPAPFSSPVTSDKPLCPLEPQLPHLENVRRTRWFEAGRRKLAGLSLTLEPLSCLSSLLSRCAWKYDGKDAAQVLWFPRCSSPGTDGGRQEVRGGHRASWSQFFFPSIKMISKLQKS